MGSAYMGINKNGDWVQYEDYQAIAAERDALQAGLDRTQEQVDAFSEEAQEEYERAKAAEAQLAKAREFVANFATLALRSEHAPDELWLLDSDSLNHQRESAIVAARETLALIDTPTPAPSPDDLVNAALEWVAEQINRSYGQPMHHLHKTVCAAATDPATRAAIIERAGK
jgi:hypothetical protein